MQVTYAYVGPHTRNKEPVSMLDNMIRAIWNSMDGTFGDSVIAKLFTAVISIIGGLIATGLFVAAYFFVRNHFSELFSLAGRLLGKVLRLFR